MLVDIGVNLTSGRFYKDREQVITQAREAGVTKIMVTGTNVAESEEAAELVCSHPGVLYATAGIHPHHADEFSLAALESVEQLLVRPGVIAVGECGLDYNRNFSTPENQRECFRRQLQLAVKHQLPLFLHQRDAHEDFIAILDEVKDDISGGVAHCFTGSEQEMLCYLEMGLSIGITGWICDERRGQALKAMVHNIPLDRLMLETDAPYLIPRDLDPKPASNRNLPAYLPHICQTVAECYGVDYEVIANATTKNAITLFQLD